MSPNAPSNQPSPPSRSNNDRRIAIVSRRFWPYCSASELAVAGLASSIKRAGHLVEVLTIRWDHHWPSRFQFHEFPVERINGPLAGPWGSFRYLRNLTRKLHEWNPDGIVVYGIGEEAWSIAKTFGGRIPFLIRVNQDQSWHHGLASNRGARDLASVKAAETVLADSQTTADEILLQLALQPDRIEVVPDGARFHTIPNRSRTQQQSARVAISDSHPMLKVDASQPMVVCASALDGDAGLLDLIDAWPQVLRQFPKARLWIVGEGDQGRDVWDKIQDSHLVNSVVMPGSFDDLSDVLQAADVYVHPLHSDRTCSLLTQAMAAAICPVVTAPQATRGSFEHDVNGIVVEPGSPVEMAAGLLSAIENRDRRDRLGRSAWKTGSKAYDIDSHLGRFLDPLLAVDSTSRSNPESSETSSPQSQPPSSP